MAILPGLMTYSYHLSVAEGKLSPHRLMDRVEELGLKSTEWCHFPCQEPGNVDWDQVRLLDGLGRKKGIRNSVAGFAPLLAQGDERAYMIDKVRTQLEVSRFIGARRLRFHSEVENTLGIGAQAPLDLCIDNLKRVVELGEEAGVVIALENHMDFRIADFRVIYNEIDSPFLAVNLDTGNLLPLYEDVVSFARLFSDRIASCHFKALRFVWRDYGAVLTSCMPEHSLIDLHTILTILTASPREIPVHVEVVAMRSEDEDPLVAAIAGYVHRFCVQNAPGPGWATAAVDE
jgi:sugar phosphate isomerase/epimerase